MSESVSEHSTKRRGTMLLEAFEESLPNFNNLDEMQHLQFVKAIKLLSHYFKISQSRLECAELSEIQLMIGRLRQLYNQYLDENIVIASAIFIVMTHVESHYLDDQDAILVHHLTGLHVYCSIQ
jgi:hypothetical protein